MIASKNDTVTGSVEADEIPDLSTDEWADVIAAAPVRRGRPRLDAPKISTTIRLDPDIIDRLKVGGRGWQTRANALLREALGLTP